MNWLVDRIASEKQLLLSSKGDNTGSPLGATGLRRLKEDAFVTIAAKLQIYIDLSLALQSKYRDFDGLPPTELATDSGGGLVPVEAPSKDGDQTCKYRTAAIDQQRQLYAASRAILIDPAYGERILPQLVHWHDAFVRNFVTPEITVRAAVTLGPNGIVRGEPDPKANLRFTYALQGSATLTRALRAVADRSSDLVTSNEYRRKADDIERLSLDIGERFHEEFADSAKPGRYYLYPHGWTEESALRGLSHNNSQGYLIEGMEALAALNAPIWQPRLDKLLSFIATQRDETTGLLHEFNFPSGAFLPDAAGRSEFSWQASDNHETVILGHTISGLYAARGRVIANSPDPQKTPKMTKMVKSFVQTMNRIGGIHENGLLANGFQLVPGANPPFLRMGWPEGAWQVELLWQFLLNADRSGVTLSDFIVEAGNKRLSLDRLLACGLTFHGRNLFNGTTYVIENGNPLTGRVYTAPINHAADTLRDLAANLAET
jgi:hypothetical protein